MAGKYHYTISANYSNVEADSVEELKSKLRDLINDPEMPVLLAQYHTVTRVDPLTVPQAVANVQAQMPAAVVTPTPAAAPAQAAAAPQPVAATSSAPICDHGLPAKLVPAGISRNTNKPYPAFFACANDRANQCGFKQTAA